MQKPVIERIFGGGGQPNSLLIGRFDSPEDSKCSNGAPCADFELRESRHSEEQTMRHSERSEESKILEIDSSVTAFPQNDGDGMICEITRTNPHPNPLPRRGNKRRVAFTLAEVLITLGIIGVVAAMTIPTLMTNYQKHRVETRLKGFYSNMNQALRLSQEEFGDIDGLINYGSTYTYEEDVEFLKKYIAPFIKLSGYRDCTGSQAGVCVDLLDGGYMWFSVHSSGIDIVYYLEGDFEHRFIGKVPHKRFQFQLAKYDSTAMQKINSANFMEPYTYNWDGTRDDLKNSSKSWGCYKGCTFCGYCTKLIQLNGWKIPSDYPW